MEIPYINFLNCIDYRFLNRRGEGSLVYFRHPCIGLLVEGEAEFFYEGKRLRAKAGDVIYIAKSTRYYSVWYGEPDIHFYSLNYSFSKSSEYDEYPFQIVSGVDITDICKAAERFETEPMRTLGALYTFLSNLYPEMKKGYISRDTEAIIPAIKHVDNNFASKISVGELASLCNLSESHFYSKFKSAMGCTPVEYKNRLIIQKALELLTSTKKSIEEISFELGFSYPSYFRRMFKAATGESPRNIRRDTRL
ncbi:MAG: helix-turn-helix domain-containing protein [Clostridia bacterium]|nr:helix-turn-helix domain-containing protein [Clostridia bacterium]